ncbi:MAG: hypothetical protein U0984_00570 [Prosthecobacter sp.]|nr:hypothetical protein [Prosthecobacter sp.]
MSLEASNSPPPASKSGRLRFTVGVLLGCLLPLVVGEFFIRLRPPEDIKVYLGDESNLTGIYQPDPVLRASYRSVDLYKPFEAPKLADIKPLNTEEPTWIFFGNSFARGLSASMRARLKTHRILFFRESKDELHLRVGQLRLLLENGLKPDHAFFTLIPSEVSQYVMRPLDWVYVNRQGALCTNFNRPGEPLNTLLDRSWIARLAWVRSRLRNANPTFSPSSITEGVPAGTAEDFGKMFDALGELSRKHQVPITVVILPERRQILGKSSYALQATMTSLVKSAGLDSFDPRETFLAYPEKRAMYLPDWHYSPIGDDLMLDALLAHLQRTNPASARREGLPPP